MKTKPDILYLGLQRTGSTFLRGYFDAHPDIVWIREAYRLQSEVLRESYPAAARQAHRAAIEAKKRGAGEHAVWIDMYESLGMGYALLNAGRWSADLMMSTDDVAHSRLIDLDPPTLFETVRSIVPGCRVVLTIRNQIDWIFSNYHHFARLLPADRRSFTDFLRTVEGRAVLSAGHFDRNVERLHRVFGKSNVLVLPLESHGIDNGPILDTFSKFAGVDRVPFEAEQKHYNRGIDHFFGGSAEIRLESPKAGSKGGLLKMFSLSRGPDGGREGSVPSKKALHAEFAATLAPMFATSNVRLARLIETDVAALGYPV